MPRWKRTALPLPVALGAALALAPPARSADADITRAIATVKAVTREGTGNEDAAPAWKALVGKGAAALFPALEAFDEGNPTATNWLRAAVEAVAEGEAAAKRPLPAAQLEAFAKDTKYAPSARRVAYDLLVGQDATARDRLLPGFLNDKSPDLRRDAVARELDVIEKRGGPTAKADLERLFGSARDKDQVDLLAKKVEEAGGTVSVTGHFGFVTHVALVGPFDSPAGKGFATPFPPETATAATGTFTGKDNAALKWVTADTADKYGKFDLNKALGKHKNAVAYALAVLDAPRATPCEVRVTCPTSAKIFVNGKEVYAHDEYHSGSPFDGMIGRGALKAGENVVVLKVCQNNQTQQWAQDWSFQMRVCDDTGGPLPLRQKVSAGGADKLVPLGFIAAAPAKTEDKK
jgi:hypothetical protein